MRELCQKIRFEVAKVKQLLATLVGDGDAEKEDFFSRRWMNGRPSRKQKDASGKMT
jgi:hypothetical protein